MSDVIETDETLPLVTLDPRRERMALMLIRAERLARTSREATRYTAFGAMAELLNSSWSEIIIDGPAGTGKTRGGLEKLYLFARNYPGFRGLLARKTRESLTNSALVTLERDVLGVSHPAVVNGPRRNFRQSYQFENGSEIVISGLDKSEKLLSSEYDMIFVPQAEEIEEIDWELMITRLRSSLSKSTVPYQQIFGDCNPSSPYHWIARRARAGTGASARCRPR